MKRKVVQIDHSKCNSCGQCVLACRGSALGFEDGKIELVRPEGCDGLGQCMPVCFAGAISIVEEDISEETAN